MSFVIATRAEVLKTKRTASVWLTVLGAGFIPALFMLVYFLKPEGSINQLKQAPWNVHFMWGWQALSVFLFPMYIILICSLIPQIEYRNNTWKQVHATPQPLATIFLAKLMMILKLVVQLLFWFNAGIYLAGIVPALVFRAVDLPASPIPFGYFLRRNLDFFVDVLPIVALQYLLALRFRSFMAPLGAGFALWILALGALPWEYNYVIPYAYLAIDYTTTVQSRVSHALPASTQALAAAWFVVFTGVAYVVYAARGDKG